MRFHILQPEPFLGNERSRLETTLRFEYNQLFHASRQRQDNIIQVIDIPWNLKINLILTNSIECRPGFCENAAQIYLDRLCPSTVSHANYLRFCS